MRGGVELDETGPLRFVLAPAFLGACALPVAGDRQVVALEAAVDEQVPADRAYGARLTVHERVDAPGREVERRDRVGDRLAVQPGQLEIAGAGERLLLLRAVDLGQHGDGDARGDALERGRDRRDHAGVADHQVPVGAWVWGVRAAGAEQHQLVAGLGGRGPRAGHALVAVDDEVDRQPRAVPGGRRARG